MTERYIPNDTAKCLGNPLHEECSDCLRKTLPIAPGSYRQTWQGPWIQDEPCPSRWFEPAESKPDWSAA